MNLRLKVDKTQLYNLVKEKSPYPLPLLKQTEFKKAYGSRMYWLFFDTDVGQVRAALGSAGGRPFLRINHINYNSDTVDYDNVFSLKINRLIELGMVETKEAAPKRMNACKKRN